MGLKLPLSGLCVVLALLLCWHQQVSAASPHHKRRDTLTMKHQDGIRGSIQGFGGVGAPAAPRRAEPKELLPPSVNSLPGLGVLPPPSGEALMPECVPKYVTELVLPPPMPELPYKLKQGSGCYATDECRAAIAHEMHKAMEHVRELEEQSHKWEGNNQPGPKYRAQLLGGSGVQGGLMPTPPRTLDSAPGVQPDVPAQPERRELHLEEADEAFSTPIRPKEPQQQPGEHPDDEHHYEYEEYNRGPYHYHGEEQHDERDQYPPRERRHEIGDYIDRWQYEEAMKHRPPPEYFEKRRHPHTSEDYRGDGPHEASTRFDEERKRGRAEEHRRHAMAEKPKIHVPKECAEPTEYAISAKRIKQEVLPVGQKPLQPTTPGVTCPASFSATPVFAYGPDGTKGMHNWPAFTVEAKRGHPNLIQWVNNLQDKEGRYLPHLFDYAVDQTLHWANPGAVGGSTDSSPCMTCSMMSETGACSRDAACTKAATETYTGPVPTVVHVHGAADVRDYSDGYPEAWFLPAAQDIPDGFAKNGTWYETFERKYAHDTCQDWEEGSASYLYPNTQRPGNSWYHDHTLGLTRLNVYAGLAGFYFIRRFMPTYSPKDTGPELPGLPYPPPGGAEDPADIRELPLVVQDRLFANDSMLWYPVADTPSSLALTSGVQAPLWVPELLFEPSPLNPTMMTVNGRTWPRKALAPDTYRLRLLNGCNARTLILQFARTSSLVKDLGNANLNTQLYTTLPFYVIGTESGWLPQAQGPLESVIMAPAERLDVILDLSGMTSKDYVYMINTGPETPSDGRNGGDSSAHTSQLLRLEFTEPSETRPPTTFNYNKERQDALNAALLHEAPDPLPPSKQPARQVVLVEEANPSDDTVVRAVLLGTGSPTRANSNVSRAVPQPWHERPRIVTDTDSTEEWDIINLTVDAHPIHIHVSDFQVVERTNVTIVDPAQPTYEDTGVPVSNALVDQLLWVNCPTKLSKSGSGKCMAHKDTVLMLPGTRTRVRFASPQEPGVFVWHCHILEHEDNEMMAPFCVGQPGYPDPRNTSQPFCAGGGSKHSHP